MFMCVCVCVFDNVLCVCIYVYVVCSYAVSFNAANDVAEGGFEKGYGIKL